MSLPKLYRSLQQLPDKILDRFTLFLQSPIHNSHEETTQLWLALQTTAPEYDLPDEALFKLAFPDKNYKNARLRVLRNYLLEKLERFLIFTELEKDKLLQNRLLRRSMNQNRLDSIGKKAWAPITGPVYWDLDLTLEAFHLAQNELMTFVRESNRELSHDLGAVVSPLDSYYLITRLKYLCALADPMTRQEPLLEDETVKQVCALYKSNLKSSQPLASMYFHLLQLFLGKKPKMNMQRLKSLLLAHDERLDPHESLNLYTYWFNYLNYRNRSGDAHAMAEIFALYKQMIELEVLFEEGSFAANHFRNIVLVAARLKEFEWGHSFLEKYHSRIQNPWRKGVYANCNAYLLFAEGRYAEAKRQMQDIEFHDPEYKISYQMLFIRIYYETNDISGIEDMKNALKIFLYRNKQITQTARSSANNFARFALRLFHLQGLKAPKEQANKVLKAMEECPQLRDRKWLYGKAQILIDA